MLSIIRYNYAVAIKKIAAAFLAILLSLLVIGCKDSDRSKEEIGLISLREDEESESVLSKVDKGNDSISSKTDEGNDSIPSKTSKEMDEDITISEKVVDDIYVHVCGHVLSPGVYCIKSNMRLAQIIDVAGGFSEDADRDYLNLAMSVTDGSKIYVPSLEETESVLDEGVAAVSSDLMQQGTSFADEGKSNSGSGLININTASMEELKSLPGIGDVKAASITAYRDSHGDFTSIEDIKSVEGIKEGSYNKIKDLICVK